MTGWPEGLLQDDCRKLSKWLANTPEARRNVRQNLKEFMHKRLQTLADFLRTVPEKHFDLDNWRQTMPDDYEGYRDTATDEALLSHTCGTRACAVGWACAVPAFQAEGLHWDMMPCLTDGDVSLYGWEAVTTFFDIHDHAAHHLFDAESYMDGTPNEVADAIESYIEQAQTWSVEQEHGTS